MDEKFLDILKKGKSINPRDEFIKESYNRIFSIPQKPKTRLGVFQMRVFENITFGLSLSLAVILVFVILSGFYWGLPGQNQTPEKREISREAENIDFEIHLGEAKYYTDSAEEMATILKEINQPNNENNERVIQ